MAYPFPERFKNLQVLPFVNGLPLIFKSILFVNETLPSPSNLCKITCVFWSEQCDFLCFLIWTMRFFVFSDLNNAISCVFWTEQCDFLCFLIRSMRFLVFSDQNNAIYCVFWSEQCDLLCFLIRTVWFFVFSDQKNAIYCVFWSEQCDFLCFLIRTMRFVLLATVCAILSDLVNMEHLAIWEVRNLLGLWRRIGI